MMIMTILAMIMMTRGDVNDCTIAQVVLIDSSFKRSLWWPCDHNVHDDYHDDLMMIIMIILMTAPLHLLCLWIVGLKRLLFQSRSLKTEFSDFVGNFLFLQTTLSHCNGELEMSNLKKTMQIFTSTNFYVKQGRVSHWEIRFVKDCFKNFFLQTTKSHLEFTQFYSFPFYPKVTYQCYKNHTEYMFLSSN